MKSWNTEYGRVIVGEPEQLFAEVADRGIAAWRSSTNTPCTWALTGGSTPKAWYQWCVATRALPAELTQAVHWFVGDERHVPLESADSNFGNASRMLLDPLGVPTALRHPWLVSATPQLAADAMTREVAGIQGADKAFSLCLLGLGDDSHTASLFPGSPLLRPDAGNEMFAAIEVPGKGWRLTLTAAGLGACDQIVVHATGASKSEAVRRVWSQTGSEIEVPAKLLRRFADRTTWLLDTAAARSCPLFGA
jgi:6-phosphogluconolactonase